MTTGTDRIQAIFQDARALQADALETLAATPPVGQDGAQDQALPGEWFIEVQG